MIQKFNDSKIQFVAISAIRGLKTKINHINMKFEQINIKTHQMVIFSHLACFFYVFTPYLCRKF